MRLIVAASQVQKSQHVIFCFNKVTFYCYQKQTGTIIRPNSNWGMEIIVASACLQKAT